MIQPVLFSSEYLEDLDQARISSSLDMWASWFGDLN